MGGQFHEEDMYKNNRVLWLAGTGGTTGSGSGPIYGNPPMSGETLGIPNGFHRLRFQRVSTQSATESLLSRHFQQ
jgi:hypothetical protein